METSLVFFSCPRFVEIQPNQSVLIEFTSQKPVMNRRQSLVMNRRQSLVMTCYRQQLPEDLSQFDCLTLCREVSPGLTEILTFLETHQLPNILVLILYNLHNPFEILRSLSRENFKSLKCIMVINSSDDRTKWVQSLYSFPLIQPLSPLKTILSCHSCFPISPSNDHSTWTNLQTGEILSENYSSYYGVCETPQRNLDKIKKLRDEMMRLMIRQNEELQNRGLQNRELQNENSGKGRNEPR